MKITVEMSDKVKKFECESVAIVTNRGDIVSYGNACDEADILTTVAGVDIVFDKLLKLLNKEYHISYEEIYSLIGKAKSKLPDMKNGG